MPRRPPARDRQPGQPLEQPPESGSVERPRPVRNRIFPEALTEPIPVLPPAGHSTAELRGVEIVAPPDDSGPADAPAPPRQRDDARPDVPWLQNGTAERDRPAQRDRPARPDQPSQGDRPGEQDRLAPPGLPLWQRVDPAPTGRAGRSAADARPNQTARPLDPSAGQRRPVFGRRWQVAGVIISVIALTAAGALTIALSGHAGKTTPPDGHASGPGAPAAEATTRDQAAAWVVSQVNRAAVVSCDPVMCEVLAAHGVPAGDLDRLEPDTTSPLASVVIVATATVRAQFGNLLSSVYAPGVIARFGSGQFRIEIRQIAPHGAAAYLTALHTDLMDRKASGAGLLLSSRIAATATARRQLTAGQVDSRLIITIAGMAAAHPIDIVAFGGSGPGADPAMPLRFVEVTQLSHAQPSTLRPASPAFVRSMLAFLRGQPTHLGMPQTQNVRLAGGPTVLRIQFSAPSPLGLLGPQSP